ncbi:MAG: UspA protein [Chloroflexi bacterium]|nr:UspA protein [Chloroflexota bacterium]
MKKILLAFDGGDPARRALETAAELAHLTGASLAVVSVVPVRPGRFPVDPWDDTSAHATELVEARRILREQGIEADLIEPLGDPAGTIERIAEEGGYDTVVIGSRGLNAMGRLLQGSVSEHVATHARATVVVAR